MNEKIGVGITTYNSENYFQQLYNSLSGCHIDELVVVNGGKEYSKKYDCEWIQHKKNQYVSVCRNDCINFLMNRGCEHIFIIEDDMLIKNKNIFEKYINASKVSGLKYFTFVSTSPGAGEPGQRKPRLVIDYDNDTSVSLYGNLCNEFTYHHRSVFEKGYFYDNDFRELLDGELTYRECIANEWTPPFWWFPDITNSDNYVCNNPNTVSRLQDESRADSRNKLIAHFTNIFIKKHNVNIGNIPNVSKEQTILQLKRIKRMGTSSYNFKPIDTSILDKSKKFDLFIPVAEKDEVKLPYIIEHAHNNLKNNHTYICSPHNIKNKITDKKITYINDKDILNIEDKSFITFRPNWTYQQFLKLFFTQGESEYFFVLDSDTVILDKLELFDEQNPVWFYGWDQCHQPYFIFNKLLFNLDKTLLHTGIGDVGFFNKKICNNFLEYTGYKTPANMLRDIGKLLSPNFHFSEYETYSNFVNKFYKNHYRFKKLEQINLGRNLDLGEMWSNEEVKKCIDEHKNSGKSILSLHSWQV